MDLTEYRIGLALTLAIAWAPATRADDEPGTVAPAEADSDAPLPEGWPGGTEPGEIEIKQYPAYRSAIVSRDDAEGMDERNMFWPLFAHIQRRDIPMTAPVVMTFAPTIIEGSGRGEVSMEFLYRSPDEGEAGDAEGDVRVVDRPARTFVCIGLQGEVDDQRRREAVARLREWLEGQDEWVADGPPRELGYHGPMVPSDRRLGELQIPVEAAGDDQ